MRKQGLIGLVWAMSSLAFATDELSWLKGQIRQHSKDAPTLVQSYADASASYTYDQALAAITFTSAGEIETAKKLLAGLARLQDSEGSWAFAYSLDGSLREGRKPLGAMAWATLAFVRYQQQTKDARFQATWHKGLEFLEAMLVPLPDNPMARGIRFAPSDAPNTNWDETQTAALEHAVDAMAAFNAAHKLDGNPRWKTHAEALKHFVLHLWDEDRKHFWSGLNLVTGKINRSEFYLDNQSWTLLALEKSDEQKFKAAMRAACALQVRGEKGIGFKERRSPASKADFVWSEGTAGAALALEALAQDCDHASTKDYLSQLETMTEAGGVRYADRPGIEDFSYSPSVAGTAWTWFLRRRLNPFKT